MFKIIQLAFQIQVTIPFSYDVIDGNVFNSGIIDLMRRITPTLLSTGSTFSINIYPYFGHYYDPYVSLDYALGRAGSLFEDQLKLCRAALNNIGANSLPIIVGETVPSRRQSRLDVAAFVVDTLDIESVHIVVSQFEIGSKRTPY